MDLKEFMSYAPKDCQPTVISKESLRKDAAKRLNKPVEEVTEEEYKEEVERYERACNQPSDWMGS